MRTRWVYHDRLHRLPDSPGAFFASELLTLPQKLRALCEPLVPAATGDREETVREFGDRRLGPAVTSVFLDALCVGVYGTTPERLSMRAAFPLIAELEREHGSLLRGMIATKRQHSGPRGVLTSLQGGLGELATRLASTPGVEWRWSTSIRRIERAPSGYVLTDDRDSSIVEQVVVCTPAYAAAQLLAEFDRELGRLLAEIEYTPIAVVGLGYRVSTPVAAGSASEPLGGSVSPDADATRARTPDGFGVLTTTASRAPILGVLWESNVFPGRAPPGQRTLRVMIGGHRNPELVAQDDPGLIATARSGLRRVVGDDPEPATTFVQRWPQGIPCYGVGHLGRLAAIDSQVARWPGLHLNSNAYRGVAMNDCVRSSREVAERIATGTTGDRP
jgi:oxygen-dependent protoporphyrinogen oxidase